MRIVKSLVVLIAILFLTGMGYAVDENAGASSAQFLKIIPGGRGPGLGNAVTSLSGTIESMFYNPAGIGYLQSLEIGINYSRWIQDMNYSSAFFGIPIEKIGTLGLGFNGMFYGDFPIVNQDSSGGLIDTGNNTSANDTAYYLCFSRTIGDIFSLGVNVKAVVQFMEEEKAVSTGFDVGCIVKLLNKRLSIGAAVQNFGGKVKFVKESYDLPQMIKAGVGYNVLKLKMHTGLILVDLLKPMDGDYRINTGLEYGFYEIVFIRAGYQVKNELTDYTVGCGIRLPFKGNEAMIDYAYVPYGVFGVTHRVGLIFRFK